MNWNCLPWELEKAQGFLKAKEYALNENERDLRTAKMNFLKTLNLSPMIYTDVVFDDEIIFPEKTFPRRGNLRSSGRKRNFADHEKQEKIFSTDIKKIAVTNFLQK